MLRILLSFILLSTTLCASADTLRIGLVARFKDAQSVTVASSSALRITDSEASIGSSETITLEWTPKGIDIIRGDERASAGDQISVTPEQAGAAVSLTTLAGHTARYRGSIDLLLGKKGLTIVNLTDVEDYLRGVIPCEMPPGFDAEALKAQAVAARTYAWAHRSKHKKEGFDLCDGNHCQIFGGVDREAERPSQAVKDTSGLVATYEGKLISAVYSADCGGTTKSGDQPYLTSVADYPEESNSDYCERGGHTWTLSWTLSDFEKMLQKSMRDLAGLTNISVSGTDCSGRATEVKIEAERGGSTVPAGKLRSILGPTVIKSTAFTISVSDGNVSFDGRGFGHGIGLCQHGANGLAKPPYCYSFEQILKHYYTGVEILPLSSARVAQAR